MKIHLDWSDGRYSTRPLTDEEVAKRDELGLDVVYLEDSVWEAYLRHCDRDATWQILWRSISNEQYMRRREKELLPLEDAEREIARLKEELARHKRMETYWEEAYAGKQNAHHREEYVEFTCVYPQPGCDVEALPLPWRERASEILETYNPERTEGGLKYQGCCCGHEHLLLDDATAQKLRNAGFLVENDSEAVG